MRFPSRGSSCAEAADIIWHAAGDTSTDFNWQVYGISPAESRGLSSG